MKMKIEKMVSKWIECNDKFNPGKKRKVEKLGILSNDVWYGCFASKDTKNWVEGATIEGTISEREYDGKTYYDIKPLSQLDKIESMLEKLVARLPSETVSVGHGNDQESMPNEEESDLPF